MDTGPILLQHEIEIGATKPRRNWRRRMAEAGAPLVAESLVQLERGEIAPIPQDSSQATYAPILTKEHGRIDWSRTAGEIYNRIRGLAPWPGAFSTFRGRLCHIWGRPSNRRLPAMPRRSHRSPATLALSDAAIEVFAAKARGCNSKRYRSKAASASARANSRMARDCRAASASAVSDLDSLQYSACGAGSV